MSTLSQFIGGGGPKAILRGSTAYNSYTGSRPSGKAPTAVDVSTGITVNKDTSFLTQGDRSTPSGWLWNNLSYGQVIGGGSARINSSGTIIVGSGIGYNGTEFQGVAANAGTVDWEVMEY